MLKMYIDGCIGREFRGRTQGIEGSPYCLLIILDKIYIRVKFHRNNYCIMVERLSKYIYFIVKGFNCQLIITLYIKGSYLSS
jgi:hypothetical protein